MESCNIDFFTSDTHFDHSNIIIYCARPWVSEDDVDFVDGKTQFKSVEIRQHRTEMMNEKLIENWNSVIKPDDGVLFLGDLFGPIRIHADRYSEIINRLNGKIYWILGNHDYPRTYTLDRKAVRKIRSISDLQTFKINGRIMVGCHYAMRVWDRSHYGSYHVYGHSHGQLKDDPHSLSVDVSLDANSYFPVHFDDLIHTIGEKRKSLAGLEDDR